MYNVFDKTDTQIQEDVINELKWDPSVSAEDMHVYVKEGIVTLRGAVPHYYEKLQAEKAAQRVAGVRAVANEVEVNMMGSYERSDEQIAEAALDALEWSYSVPETIQVSVENGWVTLRGKTNWDYQRNAAKNAISQLMGVCGVTNNITLNNDTQTQPVSPSDVRLRIEEALKRSAESEGRRISVTVDGDTAILSGNVHSFAESDDAREAAWMAPGIMYVENNLKISDL